MAVLDAEKAALETDCIKRALAEEEGGGTMQHQEGGGTMQHQVHLNPNPILSSDPDAKFQH